MEGPIIGGERFFQGNHPSRTSTNHQSIKASIISTEKKAAKKISSARSANLKASQQVFRVIQYLQYWRGGEI